MIFDRFKKFMGSKLQKAITGGVIGVMCLSPIISFANDAYFWSVTLNTHNYTVMSYVDFDDASLSSTKEENLGNFTSLKDWKQFGMAEPSSTIDSSKLSKDDFKAFDGSGESNDVHVFMFPGLRSTTNDIDATAVDMNQANLLSQTLTNSLNQIVEDIKTTADNYSFKNPDEYANLLRRIGYCSSTAGANGGSCSFRVNGTYFEISKGNLANVPLANEQLSNDDYITLSSGSFKSSYPYRFPKGYKKNQALYDKHPNWETDNKVAFDSSDVEEKETEYLTWGDAIIQAEYSYYVKGWSYDNISEIVKPGKIEQMFTGLLSSVLNEIRSLLGLYQIPDLVFNGGSRAVTYYKGMMPNTWFSNAKKFHMICQGIAFLLISGALVKLLVEKNMSTINPAMRVNLIEGIKDLLLTGVLLILALPIFSLLGTINEQLVAIFSVSDPNTTSAFALGFGSGVSSNGGLLGSVIISVVFFIMMVYMNFVYIVRAIMISLLFATGPLYIVSVAFGSKYKGLFSTWIRELIANIYLQTFHAIIFAFFSMSGFM
ncbi:hypothetical protein BFS06_12195 [Clostridium perfringens]|uniref:Uncharacterized protein n=1 Tax=Clostridium perfringens TaxID=1502 RepID=A0A140GR06_CLOPF|nr:hypothetical protein [Clostridium perfringens]AMN30965.1 hypothetical protein JFP838_pA0049 [Clostridium perfringens]TBX14961.1 hypothetical protein BFS06_12195 [Clostridium perfringens]